MNFRIVACAALSSLLVFGQSPPAAGAPALPREITSWLDQNFPGWKLTPIITAQVQRRQKSAGRDFDLGFMWGDFDGDGQRDYVVGVSHPGPSGEFQMEFAFLRRAADTSLVNWHPRRRPS